MEPVCIFNFNFFDQKTYRCPVHGPIMNREILNWPHVGITDVCAKCVGDYFSTTFPKLEKIDATGG